MMRLLTDGDGRIVMCDILNVLMLKICVAALMPPSMRLEPSTSRHKNYIPGC